METLTVSLGYGVKCSVVTLEDTVQVLITFVLFLTKNRWEKVIIPVLDLGCGNTTAYLVFTQEIYTRVSDCVSIAWISALLLQGHLPAF